MFHVYSIHEDPILSVVVASFCCFSIWHCWLLSKYVHPLMQRTTVHIRTEIHIHTAKIMWPYVVWVAFGPYYSQISMCPKFVLGALTPVLRNIHFWWDHPRCIWIPGVNRAFVSFYYPFYLSISPIYRQKHRHTQRRWRGLVVHWSLITSVSIGADLGQLLWVVYLLYSPCVLHQLSIFALLFVFLPSSSVGLIMPPLITLFYL